MKLKREIIDIHEQGINEIVFILQYNRAPFTMCNILKQKNTIKAITTAKGVKIISMLRNMFMKR